MSLTAVPCLLVHGLSFGVGVGPVSFVLMATLFPQVNTESSLVHTRQYCAVIGPHTLFPQKYKSLGGTIAQTTRALVVFIQMKVGNFKSKGLNNRVVNGPSRSLIVPVEDPY